MNPYVIVGVVLAWLGTVAVVGFGGHRMASNACKAEAGVVVSENKGVQDARDGTIDTIGAQTAAGRDAAVNDTRSTTHASAERIRTVVVPGDCRNVDPVVLQELEAGRERINAKIRDGLRQRSAGRDRAPTQH